tara:strand:- start:318 stop:890 length:573 start_codon:yes stop_codon:yes gene_type:complete
MALTRLGPNQSLNLASNVTGTLPAANGGTGATSFAPGKILQVVQTKIDSVISQSCNVGTRYDVTGLSASITPSSSSNKVLVHSSINFNNAAGEGFKGYLVRGSTDIGVSTAASSSTATFPLGTMANTNNYWLNTTGGFVLDTPSTTSATTYKIQMEVLSTTYTIFINKPARNTSGDVAVPSFITLFEVAA